MLLVLCVDLDDDLGRKTEQQTPIIGRESVEEAAVALATADPEDSDVNVLFEGVRLHDEIDDETIEVAAVTGTDGSDVAANRQVGEEVDTVLASLSTGEDVHAVVITDGAQDESVIPVIRSRVPIDSVHRVVVRQAQDLESMYYTIKQVLNDPETRGTILIPLGVLLLIYPLIIVANYYQLPGMALGALSGLLGSYFLFHGLGLDRTLDVTVERTRTSLYTGRVTLVTYVVATALIVIGGASGVDVLSHLQSNVTVRDGDFGILKTVAAFVYGAIQWFAAAGITASLGRVTDEYLHDTFRWRYLNAPFYVLAIAAVLYSVSAYVLSLPFADLSFLAVVLTASTLLGVFSTLGFAIAESRNASETKTTV
jgi:putative membrane protein